MQTAISNVRHSFPTNTNGFCPSSSTGTGTDPFTIDNESVDVWCVWSINEGSSASRVVTLSAYPSTQCGATSCSGNPYLQAEVTFNDFSSLNVNNCISSTPTTCGTSMTINSWVVRPDLS